MSLDAPTGRGDRNWTKSGGKAPYPCFLLVGELSGVPHCPETRTSPGDYLYLAWSFGIRPGRRAHEPGSSSASCGRKESVGWIEHDMYYMIRGSVGAKAFFLPIRRGIKQTSKQKNWRANSLQPVPPKELRRAFCFGVFVDYSNKMLYRMLFLAEAIPFPVHISWWQETRLTETGRSSEPNLCMEKLLIS